MERKMETDAHVLNVEDWDKNNNGRSLSNGEIFVNQSNESHIFYLFVQESKNEDITKAMACDILSVTSTMNKLGYSCKRVNVKDDFNSVKSKLDAVSKLNHKSVSSFVCAMLLNQESAWYARQEKSILNCLTAPFNVRNCSTLAGTPKIFIIQIYPPKVVYRALGSGDCVDSFRKKKERDWVPLEADFLIMYSIATYADAGGSHFAKAFCETLSTWGNDTDVVRLLTKVNSLTSLHKLSGGNDDHQVSSLFCRLRAPHVLSKKGGKLILCKPRDNLQFRKYNMTNVRRGIFMIFNNKKFLGDDITDRPGTNRDRDNLEETMGGLGFKCKVYNNLGKAEIEEKLTKISNLDHSNHACLGCAILTHGGEDDTILSSDNKTLTIKDFTEKFTAARCPTLIGKPKLFFLQVCRGYNYDVANIESERYDPVTISESDYETESNFIETEKDFLISQSTTADYYSWRDSKNGSLYIRDLCETIKLRAKKQELLSILTEVNQKVAHHTITYRDKCGKKHHYKQMPCFCSRLVGEVYFFNKKKQLKETSV